MTLTFKKTGRGFAIATFTDTYGKKCSLQESSLATKPCVWLGVGNNRMHLTQEMAAELLGSLAEFVATGTLPYPFKPA